MTQGRAGVSREARYSPWKVWNDTPGFSHWVRAIWRGGYGIEVSGVSLMTNGAREHGARKERVPTAGMRRLTYGGSLTTWQGSSTGFRPGGGKGEGFGLSWVSAKAGGVGC